MKKILTILTVMLLAGVASAQESDAPRQVFVASHIDAGGLSRVTQIDVATGAETVTPVTGERFTIVGDAIVYFDRAAGRVKRIDRSGTVADHPFMQPGASSRRIDWLVSDDGRFLAWTLTEGSPTALTTVTTVANVDGANSRQVLTDGPRDGIRALPIAFSDDGGTLYMDYQPDSIGELTPYRQYAGLFSLELNVDDSEPEMLPGEPGCFCGGGMGRGRFLRMALTADLRGFDVHLYNLPGGPRAEIPALNLVGFTQSGDVIVSRDGGHAVYALAQVRDFGTTQMTIRSVFVLVDLDAGTQTALTQPITTFIRPVAWTDNDSAILFTSPSLDGTWKVNVADGTLNRIAAASYVGLLP